MTMTREKNLQNAVDVLTKANERSNKHFCGDVYTYYVDKSRYCIIVEGLLFGDELRQINCLNIIPSNNYTLIINF